MRKIFNYNKFNSDVQNTLVESFGALCNSYMDGKANTAEYQEAIISCGEEAAEYNNELYQQVSQEMQENKQFNEEFMKECVSAIPHTEFSGLEMMKNPMINGDMCVKRF